MADEGGEGAALVARLRAMPALMRERAQWLLWRFEQDPKRPAKPLKVPYYVSGRKRTGVQGSPEDRLALAAFELALQRFEHGGYDGVGFAFLPGDGLIGIDIDGAIDTDTGEVSTRCQAIIDACASYTEYSPSGKGVHIIVQGESATFKDNKVGVEVFCGRQYFTCTGRRWAGTPDEALPISAATLGRLRATVKGSKAAARAAAPAGPAPTGDLVSWLEQALQVLDSGGCSYDEWIGVGMALKSGLGEPGLVLWDYWSRKGGDRYPGTAKLEAHWKSFAGSDADGALTIFKMARRGNRWRAPKAWHDVYGTPRPGGGKVQRPADGRPGGEGESTPLPGSAQGGGDPPPDEPGDPGDPPPPPGGRDWRDEMLRSGSALRDCRENVYLCLTSHPKLSGLVGYDEFAHRVMKLRTPPWDSPAGEWTTNDDYLLGFYLAKNERLVIKAEGTIVAGVAMAAYHNRFHPVHAYLRALPAWDEVPRLAHWLHECLGAEDSDYTRLVGAWFLMGMVKRVLDPGCQMDYMVVLEGLQGQQKSTALRLLVGNDDWFADTPLRVGDKDAMLSLAGIWLYEVGELESFNRAEVTAVKQYVSSRVDRVREPFARRPTDRKRSGVFGGSTNASEYFKDPTGARRFWPVACNEEISLKRLVAWRDQLFAEAQHRLGSSDAEQRRYWPTRHEEELYLVPQQERREIVDPWFEKLSVWLDSKGNYAESGEQICDVESFTAYELLIRCLNVPVDRIDGARAMATRVGTAMHKMGWEKRRDPDGARLYRYWRPKARPPAQPGVANAPTPWRGAAVGAAPAPASAPESEVLSEF